MTATFDEVTGLCKLPNTLVYDIVVAKVGDLINPQPKIVYVRKTLELGEWTFMKRAKTDTQKFFNKVVYNYIEYDKNLDPYGEEPIRPIKIMPDDVLYPFRYASGIINHLFIGAFILLLN